MSEHQPIDTPDDSTGLQLNSERILERFGSYSVDVIYASDELRVSALSSVDGDEKTCRTYAVTVFSEAGLDLTRAFREDASSDASLGASLKRAGYDIDKVDVHIGESELPHDDHPVSQLMKTSAGTPMVLQVYQLLVHDGEALVDVATIAELHHPEHRELAEFTQAYETLPELSDDVLEPLIDMIVGPEAD